MHMHTKPFESATLKLTRDTLVKALMAIDTAQHPDTINQNIEVRLDEIESIGRKFFALVDAMCGDIEGNDLRLGALRRLFELDKDSFISSVDYSRTEFEELE